MKLRYVINNKFIWVLLLTLPLLSVQSIPSAQAVIGDACSYVSDSGNVSGIEGYDDFCIGTEELVQTLNLCKAKANPSSLQEDPGISIEGRCFLFTEDITNTESGDVGSVHGLANGTAVRRDCSNLSSYALLDPETTQTICLDEYQEAAVATYIRLGSIPKAISETLGLYTSVVPPEGIEPTTTPSSIFLGLAPAVYNLYNWALGIGALLALAIIIYGGVLYSASAGNPSRIDEAKKWITSALFGLALLFSTVIILNVVNPRLTTLEDIEITVNPEISVGFSVIGGGGEDEDAACRAEALQDVTTYGNCSNFYVADTADFNLTPGPNMLARADNFGDPYCHRQNLTLSSYKEMVKNAIVAELEDQGFCAENIEHLTNIFISSVIPREAPSFNPNALRLRGDPGLKVPECTGAWGLFQMGKDQGEGRTGDVPWIEQVHHAAVKVNQVGGEGYWATWPGGIPRLVSCSSQGSPSAGPGSGQPLGPIGD